MNLYEFFIPVEAYSSNHAYMSRGRKRFLSNEARTYKYEIEWFLEHQSELPDIEKIHLDILIGFDRETLFTKKGELKRRDTSDCIKLVEDSFSDFIGKDDKYNFVVHAEKYDAPTPYSFIYLRASEVDENKTEDFYENGRIPYPKDFVREYADFDRREVLGILDKSTKKEINCWERESYVYYIDGELNTEVLQKMDKRDIITILPLEETLVLKKKKKEAVPEDDKKMWLLSEKAIKKSKKYKYVFARDTRNMRCLKCPDDCKVLEPFKADSNLGGL